MIKVLIMSADGEVGENFPGKNFYCIRLYIVMISIIHLGVCYYNKQVSIENMVIPSEYVISIMPTGSNASQLLYTNTRNVVDMSQTESKTILEVNTTLPAKQLWDVTVLANGCKESPLTTRLELSTCMTPILYCASIIQFG